MAILSYATVGSNRLEEAVPFYDALLGTIELISIYEHPTGGRIYGHDGRPVFGVLGPYDGNAATVGNGAMSGFSFDTRQEVADFHAKALELGGTDEGGPGERAAMMYFAYFRDLDGNKLCGFSLG